MRSAAREAFNAPAPRYSEFRQAVRRYRPSDVLPFLATMASQHLPSPFDSQWAQVPPWAYAAIARESIVYGTEFRPAGFQRSDLDRLINIHNTMHEKRPEGWSLGALISGILYDQWPYATSSKSEFTRSYLLMADTEGQPRDLHREPWAEVLGGELSEVIKATFLLMVGAAVNAGTFNPSWVNQDNFRPVNELIDPKLTIATASRLTATVQAAREDARQVAAQVGVLPSYLVQHAYNPLSRTPFIDVGAPIVYAPQHQLIIRAVSPESLYYAGFKSWGKSFADRLGARVESYTGRQLRDLGQLDVRDEIVWGSSERRSVDWFVVLPSMLVLIECKSGRLNLDARAGDEKALTTAINRYIGQGRKQIAASAQGIRTGASHFESLPADREIVGLVVTAEPIHLANSPLLSGHLPPIDVPTVSISLRDVESLSVLSPTELESALRAVILDKDTREGVFHLELDKVLSREASRRPNPLIDRTFERHLSPIADARGND